MNWMLFRTKIGSQHYFWNGTKVILVKVAGTDRLEYGNEWLYGNLSIIDSHAGEKTKSFKIPAHKQTMIVVARGKFKE